MAHQRTTTPAEKHPPRPLHGARVNLFRLGGLIHTLCFLEADASESRMGELHERSCEKLGVFHQETLALQDARSALRATRAADIRNVITNGNLPNCFHGTKAMDFAVTGWPQ